MSGGETYRDTYKIYRNATTRITTWLVNAAGYHSVDHDSSAILSTGSHGDYSTLPPACVRWKNISLDQLLVLADAIQTSKDPEVSLPENTATHIHRVIDLRTQAEAFFAKFNKSVEDESNKTSPNLVSILEKLLEIPHGQPGTTDSNDSIAMPQESPNTTDGLRTTQSSTQNGITHDTSTCDLTYVVQYDIERTAEEKSFAMYALFKDFHDIREYLQNIWTEYLRGNLDIMNAAVSTDTAFAVLKQICEDIKADIDVDGHSAMINILSSHINPSKELTTEFQEWICQDTQEVLRSYVRLLQVNPVPVAIPGAFGTYDAKTDRLQLSKEQRQTEDRVLLMELLPEFSYLERARLDFPAQDLLTTALKEMIKHRQTEDLPVYTLFACQILLDIHHTLRDQADRPFKELRVTAKRTLRTIDDYFRFSECKTNEGWTSEHSEMLSHFRDFAIHWALTDQVGSIPRGARYGMKERPFWLLKNHPILCGLLIFRMNLVMNDIGITVCNAFASVPRAAQLYRCARLSGGLEIAWEDVEFLVNTQFYQSERTDSPICCEEVDSGSAFSTPKSLEWSDGSRCDDFCLFENGLLHLKTKTHVKNIFSSRYVEDGVLNVSCSDIDAIITAISGASLDNAVFVDLGRSRACKKENAEPTTAVHFLKIITAAIAMENVQLRFDFFALHRHASTFLKTALTHIDGGLRRSCETDPKGEEILTSASRDHQIEAMSNLESRCKELSTILAAFLQVGGGGTCLAAARKAARGRFVLESPVSRRTSTAIVRQSP